MTDVDAVARKCAQQIVDAAWHTAKRTPDTPMTREQVQAIIATALRERDAEWQAKLEQRQDESKHWHECYLESAKEADELTAKLDEAERATAELREQVDSLIDEAANVAECDANVSDSMSALDVELRDAPKGWRREKILELVNVIVRATRGHEAIKKQLAEAEAQAAVMRPLVEDYRDDCHVRMKIPIFDSKVMQEHIDACNAALNTTAGRALLAEVERLRGEVKKLDKQIINYVNGTLPIVR